MRSWTIRFCLDRNASPQCWHEWGLSPVCTRWCVCRVDFIVKLFPQISQINGLSSACIITWFFRVNLLASCFPHIWHTNANGSLPCSTCCFDASSISSSVWVLRCTMSSPTLRNELLHTLQVYFKDLWCVRTCALKCCWRLNPFPQMGHLCRRALAWINLWFASCLLRRYLFPQYVHSYGRSSVCSCMSSASKFLKKSTQDTLTVYKHML